MKIASDAIAAGTDLGPLFEESTAHAGLVLNRQTQHHIQDEDKFLSKYPWATDTDLQFFALGWGMGSACARGSRDRTETATVYSVEE
jgi:hypothetical protein